MWLPFAFVFLKSNFIFSKKRSKVFYFEGPPETRGGTSCAFSSIWQSIRSFTVLFKGCIFMVNINLNKTILQSIYIIFRFFLLFVCLKKFERPTANDSTKIQTRDGLFNSLTIYKRSTICLKLQTMCLKNVYTKTLIANKINIIAKAPERYSCGSFARAKLIQNIAIVN